ncbi:hypothetical protein HYV88_02810 [Candidatus Woesearchaeota archaeon]|nr:hypothetical protein [Candidatus Woesearchaeota archaeon]
MAEKPKGPYSEDVGRKVLGAYNSAIDSLIASKDSAKVLPELGKVAAVGLGGVQNIDYLGRLVADEDVENLAKAVEIFKLDADQGLQLMAEASKKLNDRLVKGYVLGYAKQEGIKPKKTPESEARELGTVVNQLYGDWIKPKDEPKQVKLRMTG